MLNGMILVCGVGRGEFQTSEQCPEFCVVVMILFCYYNILCHLIVVAVLNQGLSGNVSYMLKQVLAMQASIQKLG